MAKEFSATGPRGQDPLRGTKSPGTGYLYIAVIMFVAITAGTFLSGGFIPFDPNGPNGPPTLEPYYGVNGEDVQTINFVSKAPDPKNNLQLKTFSVRVCGATSVFDFLIDTSASMADDNKIERLRAGLQAFVKQLAPSAVVGIQTFSAVVQERVKLDYLKNNRVQVVANVQGLKADGWTKMRSGFQLAKTDLASAIGTNKFPNYNYFLIVLSDGVPETPGGSNDPPRTCLNPPGIVPDPLWGTEGRCFAIEQDPRVPTNLADDIKKMGVQIYAMGIFSKTAVSDGVMKPYLENLLMNVVSSPSNQHYYSTNTEVVNLTDMLKKLGTTLCQDFIGGDNSLTPTTHNYPFPTYPNNITNVPVSPPGGHF